MYISQSLLISTVYLTLRHTNANNNSRYPCGKIVSSRSIVGFVVNRLSILSMYVIIIIIIYYYFQGIYAGKNLESMNRVNGLTMFILKWTGSFPENTNE